MEENIILNKEDLEDRERESKIDTIHEYGYGIECDFEEKDSYDEYPCEECDDVQIDMCHSKCCDICNHEFAESINFGGCDTEEEFWSQLLD